ncbi:MAG: DUF4130 domain-containing protein, partial [Myxococcota bacterium]
GEGLFGEEPLSNDADSSRPPLKLPPAFLKLARTVAFHRDPARWETLYRTVWRLTHGERGLMSDAADPDVVQLDRWSKAVRRDVHKMKAFVRFRQLDEAGTPLRPAILWMDVRADKEAADVVATGDPALVINGNGHGHAVAAPTKVLKKMIEAAEADEDKEKLGKLLAKAQELGL